MPRVLVTGMSGAGKSTLLGELSRRGHRAVDTDYDGWTSPDGTWAEARMAALLAEEPDLIVSGTVAKIFEPLAAQNINVDMIVQASPVEDQASALTFTIPKESLDRSLDTLNRHKDQIGFTEILHYTDVVKVSVVGVGMRSNPGVAAKMFETLAERRINIFAISTSEIKISVIVDMDYAELAVRVLHTAYGLDAEDEA